MLLKGVNGITKFVMLMVILIASFHAFRPKGIVLGEQAETRASHSSLYYLDEDLRQENINLLQNLRMKNVRRGKGVFSFARSSRFNASESVCVTLSVDKKVRNTWQANINTSQLSNGDDNAIGVDKSADIVAPIYGW